MGAGYSPGFIGGMGGFFNAVFSGYGKDLEIEADKRGAEIAAKAGYDVASGIRLLEKIHARGSKNYPKNRANIVARHLATIGLNFEAGPHVTSRKKRYNDMLK